MIYVIVGAVGLYLVILISVLWRDVSHLTRRVTQLEAILAVLTKGKRSMQ